MTRDILLVLFGAALYSAGRAALYRIARKRAHEHIARLAAVANLTAPHQLIGFDVLVSDLIPPNSVMLLPNGRLAMHTATLGEIRKASGT